MVGTHPQKRQQTGAVGVLLTELQMKKNPLKQTSNLEVIQEETPQTLTPWSLSIELTKKRNPNLQPLPNSSLHTLASHPSNLTHWLEQWHKLQTLLPSPQTAWWPEPWELEYPEEEHPPAPKASSSHYSPHNTNKEMEVEMILLNLTDEILENAWREGVVVVVEMEITQGVVEGVVEVEEEENLILRAMAIWPTQGHYWINW